MELEHLTCKAEVLEAMSDTELLAFYAPVLHITRPERAQLNPKNKQSEFRMPVADPKFAAGLAIAKAAGVDVSELMKLKIRNKKR